MLIRWHLGIAPYIRCFMTDSSGHAENLRIQERHLYHNLRSGTPPLTSVGDLQVLSLIIGTLLSTSRAVHTSKTTPQEKTEVRCKWAGYVRAGVLVGDRVASNCGGSFRFIFAIRHLRPMINYAGPH